MAWFKEALTKAVQQASEEYQRERARQQQGQQQSSPGGSGQRQHQSQYQQPQSPYGQPQAQYQQQYQQPQPQQQYQYQQPQYQHVPPPPPYGPTSPQQPQGLPQVQAQAEAQLQAYRAQVARDQAEAEAQQLEAQWREAERLAAQYKAQYEAQMKNAEEEMARLNLEAEKQQRQAQDELAVLNAEEAKQQQRAEEEIIREQQRLLDEIQKAKEETEVAPPLPRRPVSMVGTGQPQSYQPPPSHQSSYLSPAPGASSHPPPSPSQAHPSQPVQGQPTPSAPQSTFQSPSLPPRISPDQPVVNPSQQQVPHYPPPPPSPSQPQPQAPYASAPPPPQTSLARGESRDSHLSPAPSQGVTSPSQTPYYPPPPPSLPPREQTNPAQDDQNLHPSPAPNQGVTSPSQAPYFSPPPDSSSQPAHSPQQQPQASPHVSQPRREATPTRTKTPRVHTPGPPQEHASGAKPLPQCSSATTSAPQHWFFHPTVPEFTICAWCYIKHIYDSRFRDSFTKVYCDDKEQRRCRFSSRRLTETLFPEAINSGSLDECVTFMKKRMTIRDCLEQIQTEGDSWYTASDVPNSTLCQACFEDGVSGTSFAKHYQLQTVQGACYCDSTVWFLKRKLSEYLKEDNWAKFAGEMSVRVTLPPCPQMEDIKANDRQWYKPKLNNGPSSLQACVTCFFDYFYRSEDEDLFEQVTGGDFGTRCTMGQVNHLIPMRQALADEDRSLFWKAAFEVDKHPFCHKEGIKGGTWYTLPGDTPGWGICGACYEGVIKTVGGSRWFIQDKEVSQDETYLCCFNMNHARVQGSLQAYDNAHNLGDWKLLADYAAKWTNVRPCPRAKLKSGKNRPWWGWGVLAICEECYLNFAQGTALEPRFPLKGAREPDNERMCDLFSPRMRGLYTEACKTGDLEGLLAIAEQRHVIYTQTIMQAEQILVQQRLAVMKAQYLGQQGTFYKSLGWSQDAVMGHSYTVGNSYAGYGHANSFVMQGHAYDRQASEMRSQVGGGSVLQVGMLEARWKEVE
ncbi:uncharacterized protein NECHADRAFT_34719 [Fusarium vanettenii 77-13-4]|uniref:Integral membrane protein n=1 Tax=Fusarium vanettenii (strain ATCC MYA-4622 / CBS 123669 / FGSC 9596 / NRRL 45880 / 77-13-4) TaxID=660122 RepID=C7ZCM0_FUSV7|nr:uncharacterized protein NECHADRAFT_34719 [Fusarium vanettenii 77-13-4]EEU38390.1 hypothetical protein NECHADRAFT_34719 [Fusarium vanettenii 77-13-4]